MLVLTFLFLSPGLSLYAQPYGGRGDALTLKLAVIGPGDELYFWWGHIGLVVEDQITGQSRFFDWGVFSFENENFFVNFAFGRLIYSCAVSPAELNYNHYIRTNRDITLYTLDLPPDKKEAVLHFAENNVLPGNRDYQYHHFRDNCATRIRDILDMAVDGQFSGVYGSAPGRFTLRQHVRRHTWFSPFFDWLLNFLMGQNIDQPITVWDDMFLPSELPRNLQEFRYTDSGGNTRNIISSVEVLNRAVGRPQALGIPRLQWPVELAWSLVLSCLLLISYFLWGKRLRYRPFLGIVHAFLGLFFGISGSALFFMTFFTNHDYCYNNSNILFVNPLLLAAVPLGLLFAFTENRRKQFVAGRLLRFLWTFILLGNFLTMVIKLSPSFYQQNQVTQFMILPLTLALIFIMVHMSFSEQSRMVEKN